jgi:hypothetical protein
MTERRATERRTARARLRYPERRTGFDRRIPHSAITWYRDHPEVIAAALIGVVVLNVSDLLLTLRALDRAATEANPLLAVLFDYNPAVAGAFKLLAGLGVVLVIWRMRRYRRILELSLVALALFGVVLAYQLTLVVTAA